MSETVVEMNYLSVEDLKGGRVFQSCHSGAAYHKFSGKHFSNLLWIKKSSKVLIYGSFTGYQWNPGG